MNNFSFYYSEKIPEFINEFSAVNEMLRLKDIGMNCGCEYTDFKTYRGIKPYYRYEHSVCAALITYKFSNNMVQSLAALFHDIATPAFAHSIDFLHGDYLTQESTEKHTEDIIRGSPEICALLQKYRISIDDIKDYHKYPIADNDTPRLSADRLEYTIGNLENYKFSELNNLRKYYNDLVIAENEFNEPEISFKSIKIAFEFAKDALKCSYLYECDEDRYAMQTLSEIISFAIKSGVICENDLYTTESKVIAKLNGNTKTAEMWKSYCRLSSLISNESVPLSKRRVVNAKKRYIIPFVCGKGRLTDLDREFENMINEFLSKKHDNWLYAE
ncbi:MAG: HD domain-containing protein [Clostridiales bacterium]|nr:HD domain-containing protein [Clostridiales bacterium]